MIKKFTQLTSLILPLLMMSQQSNMQLLFNWIDDGSIINIEKNPGDNWVGNIYNEVWGFVQNGHEFAVIGSTQGTHIFDVTDPENSIIVASINGGSTSSQVVHRDFHTFQGYLYAVADEMDSSTLQIIDIKNLPNSFSVVYDSNDLITRSHNIFIDEANATMYSCGGKINGSPNNLSLISLDDPENPVLISQYNNQGYVHDIFVKNNIGYLNCAENGFHIVDFSQPTSPVTLGSLTDYPFKGYNHSGWLSENNIYVFADENHGYKLKVCDVSNVNDIQVLSTILSEVDENSIAHNIIINGNLLYVSHYYDGLWIWDISDPQNVTYVTSYDTYPLENGNSYKGAWGVYPFLPSGNILVSDMQFGLFVLSPPNLNSINEVMTNLKVYPNPVYDEFIVKTKTNDSKTIVVHDIFGKVYFTQISTETDFRIDTSNFSNGIYFVKVYDKKSVESVKVIKV